MQAILELIVDRNDDIVSAAVRRADGSLAVEVGDHAQTWQPLVDGKSSTDPGRPSRFTRTTSSGDEVELAFRAAVATGLVGLRRQPSSALRGLCRNRSRFCSRASTCARHCNTSILRKSCPGRVRSALDTLAEGLLVLDDKYRIMLANQSLAEIVGEPPERLIGRRASELPWVSASAGDQLEYPWETAMRDEVPLHWRDDAAGRPEGQTPLVHGQLHTDPRQRREDSRCVGQPGRCHAVGGDPGRTQPLEGIRGCREPGEERFPRPDES